ncbi:3-oxoacyl-[acyl-carrier-protein] synthase I, chloroplastic-like protein [Tanacetum coccineum]
MEAQALLLFTPLYVPPLRKNPLTMMVKSPACTTTKRPYILAYHATTTAPKREKDPKKRVVITGDGENAHATSTVVGDWAEVKALNHVFKKTEGVKVNATKSIIGHCMAAAGGLQAITTIKAIQTGWLHPTINQLKLEPAIEFDTVAYQKQEHEINVAISNSFGFGGHNSVVVFSAFKS